MAVGVIAGLLFALAGCIVAALAALRVKKRADALKAEAQAVVDVKAAQATALRLQTSLEAVGPLLDRAKAAIDEINTGLTEMKLPQAMAALRTAGAAIRLLASLR